MRVLFYFNSMEAAGGIERVISKHIEFLSDSFQIFLVTKDDKKSFYFLPSSVEHISLKIRFTMDMDSRLRRALKILKTFMSTRSQLNSAILDINPDIIYVASPLNLLEVFFAQLSCKNILVTEHSSYNAYNLVYKLIVGMLYKSVKLLTVPTKDDSKLYTSLGIVNTYLPNPLTFYPKSISSLRNKIVLNVGRLTDDKQHDILIKIWSLSKGRDLGWKLKIVGQGENLSKILGLINRYNLQDSISILPVTREIEKEFFSASIFALTSRIEGFGLVLAEAMAFGLPCIAFNCPSGPKDIVRNNHSGYLITENDIFSFVKRLDDLMLNEDLRVTLGKQARIDVLDFKEEKIRKQFNVLINNKFVKN